jgi:hypothetical protein
MLRLYEVFLKLQNESSYGLSVYLRFSLDCLARKSTWNQNKFQLDFFVATRNPAISESHENLWDLRTKNQKDSQIVERVQVSGKEVSGDSLIQSNFQHYQ